MKNSRVIMVIKQICMTVARNPPVFLSVDTRSFVFYFFQIFIYVLKPIFFSSLYELRLRR